MEKDYFVLKNTAVLEYSYEDGSINESKVESNLTTVYNVSLNINSCCYNCHVKRFYNKLHLYKSNKISFYNENERSLNNIYIKLKVPNNMKYIPRSIKMDALFQIKGYDESGYIEVLINELKLGQSVDITFDTSKVYDKCIPKDSSRYMVAIVLAEYYFNGNDNEKIYDEKKYFLYSS